LSWIKQLVVTRNTPLNRYFEKLIDVFFRASFLIILTIAIFLVLLFLCRISWDIFQFTHVGQKYVSLYAGRSQIISDILNSNLISLAFDITLSSFISCFFISIFSQLFLITRYLYLPRGLFGKIIFFGLSMAVPVAFNIQEQYLLPSFAHAYMLVLIPTLCLFSYCFQYTHQLIPEIVDIITYIRFQISSRMPELQKKIKSLIKNK